MKLVVFVVHFSHFFLHLHGCQHFACKCHLSVYRSDVDNSGLSLLFTFFPLALCLSMTLVLLYLHGSSPKTVGRNKGTAILFFPFVLLLELRECVCVRVCACECLHLYVQFMLALVNHVLCLFIMRIRTLICVFGSRSEIRGLDAFSANERPHLLLHEEGE